MPRSSESAYSIKNTTQSKSGNDTILKNQLVFDKNHDIFKGHFPGHPIVPGVLQIEAIKQIVESYLSQSIMLTKGENIKFLASINPNITSTLECQITMSPETNNGYEVRAIISKDQTVFMKFNGIFVKT